MDSEDSTGDYEESKSDDNNQPAIAPEMPQDENVTLFYDLLSEDLENKSINWKKRSELRDDTMGMNFKIWTRPMSQEKKSGI